MKKTMFICASLLAFLFGNAQAFDGTVEYQKKQQSAAVIELPFPTSVVNAAMDDYLSKKGKSRSNDIKGFSTFRNTEPMQNDSVNADLYFRTERKSRKEKEITVISLLIMPTAMQSNGTNLHHMSINDAKDFLNKLSVAIEAYNLELTIKDQNDAVIKAESKYKSLVNDGDDLKKKRGELDRKISDNDNAQQQQLKEIENQKQKLTQRVEERKS